MLCRTATLIYAFPPLKLLPCLRRIEVESIPFIFIAPEIEVGQWSDKIPGGCSVGSLKHPDLLSPEPIYLASRSLTLITQLLKPSFWETSLSKLVIPTLLKGRKSTCKVLHWTWKEYFAWCEVFLYTLAVDCPFTSLHPVQKMDITSVLMAQDLRPMKCRGGRWGCWDLSSSVEDQVSKPAVASPLDLN